MELLKKWYIQLALALIAALIFMVVLILMDIRETGEVLFETDVPGSVGELQVVSFNLEASEFIHVLVLDPDIESGWGEPDVYLEARLFDPNDDALVIVSSDELFGGYKSLDDNSARNYTKKFEFNAEVSGEYRIEIKTLTEHVEAIYIKIGRRMTE